MHSYAIPIPFQAPLYMRGSSPPYSPLASPIPGATAVAAAQVATRTVKRTWVPLICFAIFGIVTWHGYPRFDKDIVNEGENYLANVV